MGSYYRPPDDYEPPTHCGQCHEVIGYFPVIDGRKWTHVGPADHEVVMRPEGWWDVATGTTRYGITDQALADALERAGYVWWVGARRNFLDQTEEATTGCAG